MRPRLAARMRNTWVTAYRISRFLMKVGAARSTLSRFIRDYGKATQSNWRIRVRMSMAWGLRFVIGAEGSRREVPGESPHEKSRS